MKTLIPTPSGQQVPRSRWHAAWAPLLVSGLAVLCGCSSTTSGTAPTITSFTPTSGVYNATSTVTGASVTVTGTGFSTNVTSFVVYVGDVVTGTGTINSDTEFVLPVPAAAVTGPIKLVTNGGTAESTQSFIVVPTYHAISATSGAAGDSVTVSGWGLAGINEVIFTNTSTSATTSVTTFTTHTAQSLVFEIPTGLAAGSYTITLVPTPNLGLTSILLNNFTVN
jgi:hypothetical protein